MTMDWQQGGFGVYVHWPFCLAKCPYCDFNSHVRAEVDHEAWRGALVSEVARVAAETPGRRVDTVFFGGGTPSLMPPETVAAVISAIGTHWTLAPDAEISLEANPTSVEAGRFRGFRDAGVNRISMGIQSLDDRALKALGRMHSAAEARAAFDVARGLFERVSFDLIHARQGQDLDGWRAELGEALSMAVDHLSLYQLTIEPGTRFHDLLERGRLKGLPEPDLAADMYALTQELCSAAGYPGYEISNHARPGAESRHNLTYWRYGDYAGIGPGAHGRLTLAEGRTATETLREPTAWLNAVREQGHGESLREPVSGADQATEYMLMSLRLAEGSDLSRHAALAAEGIPERRIADLVEAGLLWHKGSRIGTTPQGRPLLNAILRDLLT
ncbi:coproporphyrinogen III oxidase [Paroceanicella profunda]|uniref:Heme chaperone HemW n=1 Tax=Paroceanicella profunda TaxID=2579971 RepID=A0A5B8FGJ8_9RHOB|nr:radical SAM family heme chaperone HemW [Paroceanicella profunda]QDL91311.1 coproporphyrinogen III oxidase [Paroceanicella profunda]